MQMRKYAVTVMDVYTPMRYFWTFRGAWRFYLKHRPISYRYRWDRDKWRQVSGATGIKGPK